MIWRSVAACFEGAIEKGIRKMSDTVDNVEGAWIKDQKVFVEDGAVSSYRVTLKVTFIVKSTSTKSLPTAATNTV